MQTSQVDVKIKNNESKTFKALLLSLHLHFETRYMRSLLCMRIYKIPDTKTRR